MDLGVGEEVAGTGAEDERRRLDEGQVSTKMSVFGVLPETRAESTISISLEAISAAERTDGFPWVELGSEGGPPSASGAFDKVAHAGWLVGWLAGLL